jgi:hypothetical protein
VEGNNCEWQIGLEFAEVALWKMMLVSGIRGLVAMELEVGKNLPMEVRFGRTGFADGQRPGKSCLIFYYIILPRACQYGKMHKKETPKGLLFR